jgi:hypothetical protein
LAEARWQPKLAEARWQLKLTDSFKGHKSERALENRGDALNKVRGHQDVPSIQFQNGGKKRRITEWQKNVHLYKR